MQLMQARGVQPDVISYNAAISACGKCKQLERALSLLEDMQRRGVELWQKLLLITIFDYTGVKFKHLLLEG